MSERKLSYQMAFNEAVRQAMEADDDVFAAGEDIGAFGGVFGTYAGLQATFGADRVVDIMVSSAAEPVADLHDDRVCPVGGERVAQITAWLKHTRT